MGRATATRGRWEGFLPAISVVFAATVSGDARFSEHCPTCQAFRTAALPLDSGRDVTPHTTTLHRTSITHLTLSSHQMYAHYLGVGYVITYYS